MEGIKNIAVMGMGYVGLTLSVVLAKCGFKVHGIEVNKEVLENLKKGIPHFHEKGLKTLLKYHQAEENLQIHKSLPNVPIDAYVISVGTPLLKGKKEPNIDYIQQVIKDVAAHMKKGALVILRSTVPVGLSRRLVIPRLEEVSGLTAGRDFSFVFAPERTLEGKAIIELETNSQIIGGIDEKSVTLASNLFRKLTPTILVVSSIEASEMIKIMDNSYRDVRFAYANELAMIAEKLQLDMGELVNAANTHYPRNNIPVPSPGVGGACLSKDPHILVDFATKAGYEPRLIHEARNVNERIPGQIVERVKKQLTAVGKDIAKAKIFVVGFAFKGQPETSDLRDSTTLLFLDELKKYTSTVHGFDPIVEPAELKKLGITTCTLEEGYTDADVILFMNNHASYRDLDVFEICSKMNKPAVFYDAWRMFEKHLFHDIKDVSYLGVGV